MSYHVANGDLSESLNDEVNGGNETSITIDGEIAVSITYNDVLGAVFITDAFNGLVIAIAPFRYAFFVSFLAQVIALISLQ